MSIVTNLVIALMIVSNGVETVDAIRVQPSQIEWYNGIGQYCTIDGAKVEKMDVKKSYTNFILSSMIDIKKFTKNCIQKGCTRYRKILPCELFGKEPVALLFEHFDTYVCPEHSWIMVHKGQ